MNNIIYFAMTTAGVVARLEPLGLLRSDGKQPDYASEIPWWSGKLVVWEATCVDTITPSYRSQATHEAGTVAARAESLKGEKYSEPLQTHELSHSIWHGSFSVYGQRSLLFVKELVRRLRHQVREVKAVAYLIQQ